MDENAGGAGPGPTIVGPRPEDGGAGARNIPRGMEKLLTLAGISPEWRGDILADPVGAARSAGIALSESEKAILGSVPPATISAMADSLAARAGRPVLSRAAAGLAAAALLATNLTGCDNRPVKGVQPDRPPSKASYAPSATAPIEWLGSLDEALAKAKAESLAVMVVVPHPKPGTFVTRLENPTKGHNGDTPNPGREEKSQKVILSDSSEFRAAVKAAALVPIRLPQPVAPPLNDGATEEERKRQWEAWERYEGERQAWVRNLDRCIGPWRPEMGPRDRFGEADSPSKDLPAIAFLAPDGSILSVLRQPTEESQLLEAVRSVPPLLAKWMTERRETPPIPPVVAGERPDEPDPASEE